MPCQTLFFFENTESLYFRKKQSQTGSVHIMYNVVKTLNAFFQNFVPSKYRPCTVRFSTRLPHGYRVTESKKCLYRVSGNVHCRYIVGTLPVLLGIEPVSVGTGSYGVGYRSVSVSLHGHLGVLLSPYYQLFFQIRFLKKVFDIYTLKISFPPVHLFYT